MSHNSHISPHEVVTLSVNGFFFTTPLITLQGPAAKGSVLEQIAEQYTRRSDASMLAENTSSHGVSQAPNTRTAATPSLQNSNMVVLVPASNGLQYKFGQVLCCLQRMDSGLEVIRPEDVGSVLSAAKELNISSLARILEKMAASAPSTTTVMLAESAPCDECDHQQMVHLLQQISSQMSILVNLQQQTLQALQQQHGATGRMQRPLAGPEDGMTAIMQPPQP